ncbi:MAG: tRNA epoxyqueuosine(34) reductase QueG [Myxococcales bacterium]
MEAQTRSAQVKERAAALGFDLCGIARARALDPAPLQKWLARGWDAGLSYMRERRAEREDPRVLLPDARSVVVVAASYGPQGRDPEAGNPGAAGLRVARYAQGRDYHNVLTKRARKLAAWMRADLGARVYAEVDAGAVAEKAWAQEAGLGWIGKNGLLIHERYGSWLLLGALVTDLSLEPDAPQTDRCGDCAACIPACPTQAIPEPRFVDSTRCLAFHTIEHRGPIPPELAARAGGRVFGCDACQEACPWNRRALPGTLVQLQARPGQRALALDHVLGLTDDEMRRRYQGTPLMRARRDGLVRSALAVGPRPLPPAARERAAKLLDDAAEGVRVEARRALDAS